jgi:hypothetical protein
MRNLLTKFCHKFSQSDRPAFPDYYVQIENEKKLQDEETWQRLRHQMKIENQKKIQQEWEQSKEKWEQSKEEWLKQKSLTYQQMFKRLKKLYEEFEERRFNSHTVSCYTYSPPCKFLDRYQLKDFFQKGLYYLQVIDSPATSEVLPLLKKYKRTLETLQYYGLNLSLKTIQLKEGDLFYLTIKFCINNIVCETREVPLPHLKYLNAMKELFRIGMFNGYTFDERKISGSEKRETANNWNLVREFFSTISNDNISRMFSNLDEFLGQ